MRIDYSKQTGKKISIKGKYNLLINMTDILYMECEGNYTTLYLNLYLGDKRVCYTETKHLKQFETELSDYGFFRVNNNTLVNGYHIKKVNSKSLFLNDDFEIKISRRRYNSLKKHL